MAEIMEGIHPTRMELLEIKDRTVLAEKGHKLLKEKRDSLMTEFFEEVKKAKGSKEELFSVMERGYSSLMKAEALMDSAQVESIASATPDMWEESISHRSIMGVKTPQIELTRKGGSGEGSLERGYSITFTSSKLQESTTYFDKVVEYIGKVVEAEETIRRLGEEIKKTRRRVNALEYLMLPRLKNTEHYIEMRLEEMEREAFFRLKMVKKKRGRAAT